MRASRFRVKNTVVPSILTAVVLLSTGCAEFGRVNYPSRFVYLTSEDVGDRMQRIAGRMANLDRLLDELSSGADARLVAERMAADIDQIDLIAQELGQGGPGTNHLLLEAHLDDFVSSLNDARITLSATPPRFYEAAQIVGSCNACHRFR
jgi:hypothetical protein